jgi:glycosyltransferase involved in cell wall biosynthesis
LFYRGRLLVTVHDLFHLAMPELSGGLHKRLYAKYLFSAVRRKSRALVFDSEFTSSEFLRLVGKPRSGVHVIHLGVDGRWFNLPKRSRPYSAPYILYIGNVKPHKNLAALISAFRTIHKEIPHDLVIAGKSEGFITGDNEAKESALASDIRGRVVFTGLVDQETLEQYYCHADGFVFPSLYEGFGLPPLEAMACGCPTVVSSAASLPEVCGDAALYCDPYSPEDIAKKILQIVRDADLRSRLKEKGLVRAAAFSWDATAFAVSDLITGCMLADREGK